MLEPHVHLLASRDDNQHAFRSAAPEGPTEVGKAYGGQRFGERRRGRGGGSGSLSTAAAIDGAAAAAFVSLAPWKNGKSI